MKKIEKISDILFIVLFLVIIGSIIYGIKPMIVMSGSMQPEVSVGSLCLVNSRASIEDIKEGDIITYTLQDGKVTHRVKEIKQEGIITKGDANRVEDLGIVTEDNFYGKVLCTVPSVGYLLYWVKENLTAAVLIVAGLILMPWESILGFLKRNKREKAVN